MSRQIKDIKDKNTGQLVYPRTHAKATYMSDGLTIEDTIKPLKERVTELEQDKQNKNLYFSNITASNWVSDNTYEDFSYRCDISCSGVTSNMYAQVVFDVAQATSGNYAPICETGNNIVKIWSFINDPITIPVIVVYK